MRTLERFQIIYEHPQGVFFAGGMVIGHVTVVLNEAMQMRGISIILNGKAKVHWSTSSGKNRKSFREEEIYFTVKQDLLPVSGNQDTLTLEAGSYSYPFQVNLPASLPSSFEGKYGYVRYYAEAKIDRPWKFDHETKEAFTVLGVLDLNYEQPAFREPFSLQEQKDVGCCCISGLVDAVVTINRKCFVPGETILLRAKIINNSNSEIPGSVVTLEQHIDFLARSTQFFSSGNIHTKTRKEHVTSLELNTIQAGETKEWNNITVVVPSIPPSRLVGCNIINLDYWLVFKINVNVTTFKLPFQLVIGTIPLRHQFQPGAVIMTQPAAPPPPFGSGTAICTTSYGLPYEMPPPSYEECVLGKVTIKEETDSDYVRGNLNWAPVYPMYHPPSAEQPSAD